MLVSSITKFNSAGNMNNAVSGILHASNCMIGTAGSMNAFGGENDLYLINQIDQQLSLDIINNSLQYKLAYLQWETAEKCCDEGGKNSFSALV